jgi:hypothetical protein
VKYNSSLPLFICAIAVAFEGCYVGPSIWDGQWTLNKLKSDYGGPTFSIAISPSGEYQIDNGAYDYSFRCDGKEYPAPSGNTTSCTQVSALAIALRQRTSGDAAATTRWEVSADGKTLTTWGKKIQPDGSLRPEEKVFERISGASGFSGRWRETKPLESLSRTAVLVLNHGAFHLEFPDIGQFSDSRANEAASPVRGLNEPLGFSRSVRILDARQLQTEDSFAGRIIRRTTWRISENGRTLYVESWAPESPAQKDLLVYERY